MIGAIIGDIVGSRFEFNNYLSKDFAFVTPACRFTDDTVMTCAVAQALMDSREDFADLSEKTVAAMQRIGRQYPVLPYSRERGGEVFEYPSWPEAKFESLVGEHLIPYGYKSYEEYYEKIDSLIEQHHDEEEIVRLLKKCKENIALFNHKEDWSICKYIGEDTGEVLGLHKGGYYYWPCLASEGKYRGVIDDEEFTAYQYPTDPDLWEIIVDPTGMAERTIYGGENALSKEAHEYIMRQVRNMQPEDMKDVRTLGPAPRLNKLEREKEEKTDMNKTVFGGYMELSEEETLARVYMSDDEVPVNISLDEDSDMDLETGVACSVELWSNEYEVSIYPSEEEYEKADTKMATISMIPKVPRALYSSRH